MNDKPRYEGQTLVGVIPHSSLCNNEADTLYAWCFWQVPFSVHEAFKDHRVVGWLQMRPREERV